MSQTVYCTYYGRGACTKGSRCSFSHDMPRGPLPPADICRFFVTGSCKYGEKCIKSHVKKQGPASARSANATRQSSRNTSPAPRSGSETARSSTHASPRSPLTPQHTSISPQPALAGDQSPHEANWQVPIPQNLPVCNGFAMLRGCSMQAECRLQHCLSESQYTLLANCLDQLLALVCYTYFTLGMCTSPTCRLRHNLVPSEYQALTDRMSQTPAVNIAHPHPVQPTFTPIVTPYAAPLSGPLCRYFFESTCVKGQNCKFSHAHPSQTVLSQPHVAYLEQPSYQRPCTFFQQGKCRRGDSCTYLHEISQPDSHDRGSVKDTAQPINWDNWDNSQNNSTWDLPDDNGTERKEPSTDRWGAVDDGQAQSSTANQGSGDQEDTEDDEDPWGVRDTQDTPDDNVASGWGDDESWSKEPPAAQVCQFFVSNGWCNKNEQCEYRHERSQRDGHHNLSESRLEIQKSAALEGRQFGDVFNCCVLFGPGAIPERIATSFDSSSIRILNLATPDSLDLLIAPYGRIVEPEEAGLDSDTNTTFLRVTLDSAKAAAQAAISLDSVQFDSNRLIVCVDKDVVTQTLCADAPDSVSRTIKLSWPMPVLVLWLYFDSITQAKAVAAKLHESLVDGKKVTAEFRRPGTTQICGFAVTISGVPASADISGMVSSSACTTFKPSDPSYSESPEEHLIQELTAFGRVKLDVIPHDTSKTKATAYATFENTAAALKAAEVLHKKEFAFLGTGGRLSAINYFYASYNVFFRILEAVAEDIDALRDHNPNCFVRIDDVEVHKVVRMAAPAKDKDAFTRLKIQLDLLLRGELFADEHDKFVWHDYFQLESCQQALLQLGKHNRVYIERDFLNEALRIHGASERRDRAKEGILKMLDMVDKLQKGVAIPPRSMRHLLDTGLDEIYAAFDQTKKKIELNLTSRTLTVRLPQEEVQKIEIMLASMVAVEPESATDNPCCSLCGLVAFDSFTLDVCGHVYDRQCAQQLFKEAIRPGVSGVHCTAEVVGEDNEKHTCMALVPHEGYADFLDAYEQQNLLESSFLAHFHSSVAKGLHFCPVPHCSTLYRKTFVPADGRAIQCTQCGQWICTFCCVDFHEGLTCPQYQCFAKGCLPNCECGVAATDHEGADPSVGEGKPDSIRTWDQERLREPSEVEVDSDDVTEKGDNCGDDSSGAKFHVALEESTRAA